MVASFCQLGVRCVTFLEKTNVDLSSIQSRVCIHPFRGSSHASLAPRRRLKLVFETAKREVNCKVRRHERDFHGILQVHIILSLEFWLDFIELRCVTVALRCIAVEKRKGVVMGPAEVWARVGPGLAGAVFGGGWWFWVDAAVCSSMTVPFLHYIPGHTIFSPPSPPLQLRFLVPIEEDDCIVWKL